jgi:hypothetical protein
MMHVHFGGGGLELRMVADGPDADAAGPDLAGSGGWLRESGSMAIRKVEEAGVGG